jgi:anti-anti-sigma factor
MTLLTEAPARSVVPGPALPPSAATAPPGVHATVTVPVAGALDVTTLPRVREQLEQAAAGRPDRLVVDLSDCSFVDASALAVLLDLHRRLSRTGGVLTLSGVRPRVLRLLSLTGLRRVFDLAENGTQARGTRTDGWSASSASAARGGVTNL